MSDDLPRLSGCLVAPVILSKHPIGDEEWGKQARFRVPNPAWRWWAPWRGRWQSVGIDDLLHGR